MAIIPWDPFKEVEKFFGQDNFLPIIPTHWVKFPLTDVYKEGNNIIVKVEIPDIDPKSLELSIQENALRIEGKADKKQESKKRNYYQKEIRRESFERIISLPSEVQAKKAKASYHNGLLVIEIPEAKKAISGAKIPIKVKE